MQVEQINIEEILPYINNSKVHNKKQIDKIAASIKEFGFNNPILIDNDKTVIAGHARLEAANKLKLKKVPCIKLGHLTEAQKKAYIIADNRLGEIESEWDWDILKIEVQDILNEDINIDLIGFELDDFDFGEEEKFEGDPNEIPEEVEPRCKRGDIWQLGDHRLMCGDSTSLAHLERLCGGQLVDMWLTDPPYNVAYEGKTRDALKIQNDEMGDEQFRLFLRDAYVAADSVMKPGAVFYIWHADSEGYNFRGAALDAGWQIRQCLIWKKSSMVMGRQDYHWKHESCLYGWKAGAAHLWAADRKQTTILEFDKPVRNGEHPTMKPVELFEYQILNNTKGGDIVLDSFGGSGTTLIAAEKNKRKSFVIELDPKYCDVIIKRWEDFTGKTAELLENLGT